MRNGPVSDLPQAPISSQRFGEPRVTHGVLVEVRDGTLLSLDLLRPDAELGRPRNGPANSGP